MIWWIIFRKELKSFFTSPIIWVLCGLFALISGWMFFNLFVGYVDNTQNLPPQLQGEWDYLNQVVLQMMGNINMLLLFICPLVSMRLFAEEKKEDVLELYYASPIKESSLVIGKYLACVVSVLFIISPSFLYPILMRSVGLDDTGIYFSGFFALFMNICVYVSIGGLSSSLTRNQIVSALISFVLILGTWMLAMGSQITQNYFLSLWARYLSLITHYEVLAKGLLRTTDLIFYFSCVLLMLFFTKKSLQSRNW